MFIVRLLFLIIIPLVFALTCTETTELNIRPLDTNEEKLRLNPDAEETEEQQEPEQYKYEPRKKYRIRYS